MWVTVELLEPPADHLQAPLQALLVGVGNIVIITAGTVTRAVIATGVPGSVVVATIIAARRSAAARW